MQDTVIIDDFVVQYVARIRHRLRSYQQIRRHLDRIAHHFTGRQVQSIRQKDIIEYIEQRQDQGIKPSSINVELGIFSGAIAYSNKRWELQLTNPVHGQFFKPAPGRLRYLEKPEAAKLIANAKNTRSNVLADLIELALNTGARKTELLRIQWKSIDLTRRILTIEAETTKTGKRRYLPINQAAAQTIERIKQRQQRAGIQTPWLFSNKQGKPAKYPDNTFRRVVKESGIQDFCFHDLRHTFASWLVSEGVELIKVRDLLGHSSIRMTERYAHLAPFRLHEAVAVLDGMYQTQPLDFGD